MKTSGVFFLGLTGTKKKKNLPSSKPRRPDIVGLGLKSSRAAVEKLGRLYQKIQGKVIGQGGGEPVSAEFFSGSRVGKAQSFDSYMSPAFIKQAQAQLGNFRNNVCLE